MTQGGTSIASRVAEGITQASPVSLSRVLLLLLVPVLLLRHVTAEATTSQASVKLELFYNDNLEEPKDSNGTFQQTDVLESKNGSVESDPETGNRSWKKNGRKIRNRDEQETLNSGSDLMQIPTIATIDLEDRSSTTAKEDHGYLVTLQKPIPEVTTPVISHLAHQSIKSKNIEDFGNSEEYIDSGTGSDDRGVTSKPISLLNDTLVNYYETPSDKNERTDRNGSERNSTEAALHTGSNLLSDNVHANRQEYQPKREVELFGNGSYLMTSVKLNSGSSTSKSEINEKSNFFTTIVESSSLNPNVDDQKDADKEKRKKKKTMAMTMTGDPGNENQDTRSTSSTSINIPESRTDSDINVSHNESFKVKEWPYPYTTSFHHLVHDGKEETTAQGDINMTSPKSVKETLQYGNAIGNQESISKEALDISSFSTVPQPVLTTPSTKPMNSKRSSNFSKLELSSSQLLYSTTPTIMTTLMTSTSTFLPGNSTTTEEDNLTQSLTTNLNQNSTSSTVTSTPTTTTIMMDSGNVTMAVTEPEEINTPTVNPPATSNEIQSDLTDTSPIFSLSNVTEPVKKYFSTTAADELTLFQTTPKPDANSTVMFATLSPSSTTETVVSLSSAENYINKSTNEPLHEAVTEKETSTIAVEYEFVGLTEFIPSEKYVTSTGKENINTSTEKDDHDDRVSTNTDQSTETWTSIPNIEVTIRSDNDSLVNLKNDTLRPRMMETSEIEESPVMTTYPTVFNSDSTTELYVTVSDKDLDTTTPAIVNSTQFTLNLDTSADNESISTLSSVSLDPRNANSQTTDVTIEVSNSSAEFTTTSTFENSVESTVNTTIGSTVDNTVRTTVDDTMRSTVDNTVETTVDDAVGSTVDNTMRTTVNDTVRSTVDDIVGSTIDITTMGATVDSTETTKVNITVRTTVDDTVRSTVDDTVITTIDNTVGSTVEIMVENSPSTEIANDSTITTTMISTSAATASISTSTITVPRKTVAPEEITVLARIVFGGSWNEVCQILPDLQNSLAKLLMLGTEKYVSPYQIVFHQTQCENTSETSASNSTLTAVLVYVLDEHGNFDANMTELLPSLHKMYPITTALPIHSFVLVRESDSGNAIAVVVVSCVAFICLVLLAGLLFIMRKRQSRFNYGKRCHPISLDAYSVDSVSAFNSVRRKGIARASKRSYGNPTFEDSSITPSHPLDFDGLSTFCNDKTAIAEEYESIPQVSARLDEVPVGAESKNKYSNVIPLPETRVPLQRLNNDPLTEYINASYVRGPKNASKYYIACQAPTESTTTDFWRMIWEQQSKVIVMLTDIVENGVAMCTEYVPPSEVTDCHRLYGDYQVTLKKRETKEKYAISTLHLKNLENNTFREISHIWYLWPNNGVPNDATGLIAVILEARALQRAASGPMVVHCSPGTGRTGTLIALDLGIRQYEVTRTVDIPRVVYTIRRDRAGAVQTKEQYGFIYKALNLYATKLTSQRPK